MVVVSLSCGGSDICYNGNCTKIHTSSGYNSNTSNITLDLNIPIILNNRN